MSAPPSKSVSVLNVHSKPLLFLSNGPYKPDKWFADTVQGSGPEKDCHVWQQGVKEAAQFIEALTEPGELVLDPFLGSGTTAVAAKGLGRRFRGCDVDPEAVAVARGRVAEA